MKTILNKLAAATLLTFLAISSLLAQKPAFLEAGTNKSAANSGGAEILWRPSETLEKQKIEIDKELAEKRIEAEKDIARSSNDTHRLIIHDLAWNSWVLFVIAIFFFGYLKDKRRHETIRVMIDKGTPITPEILDGLRKKSRLGARAYDPQGYLCWGITETSVAIALLVAYNSPAGRIAGSIVLAVGVANLILWVIERAHSNGGQSK